MASQYRGGRGGEDTGRSSALVHLQRLAWGGMAGNFGSHLGIKSKYFYTVRHIRTGLDVQSTSLFAVTNLNRSDGAYLGAVDPSNHPANLRGHQNLRCSSHLDQFHTEESHERYRRELRGPNDVLFLRLVAGSVIKCLCGGTDCPRECHHGTVAILLAWY